jgi:ribosomal protein S4
MRLTRTNPNAFHPKYRTYKKLRNDIWGTLAFLNKKNKFYRTMKLQAYVQLKKRIRRLKLNRRKRIYKAFRTRKPTPQQFSIRGKAQIKLKKPLNFRSSLQILRKKMLAFYGFRLRRKPQRKLFAHTNKATKKTQMMLFQNRFIFPSISKKAPNAFESRFDVVLYRSNMVRTIPSAKRIIKEKMCFIMEPAIRRKKFFRYFSVKKHFQKIPLFHFTSLRYDLALRRKSTLLHLIRARKLLAYPPNYLMVNFNSMIALRIREPSPQLVRYPFPGTLAYFLGLAIYF